MEIVKQSGLEQVEQTSVLDRFGSYEDIAKEWETKAKMIVVTDSSQTTEMAMAKEARKKFSQLRIDVEKARKAMKEQSLRKGQAIDAVARFLTSLIIPIEDYLRSQEDFILIEAKKKQEEERMRAEAEAEKRRIEELERERLEQERIKKENETLKAETERIEREKKELEEKVLRAEAERQRLEKEKREREERVRREEEERLLKIERERAEAERMTDATKFSRYIDQLLAVEVPSMSDHVYIDKVNLVTGFLTKIK